MMSLNRRQRTMRLIQRDPRTGTRTGAYETRVQFPTYLCLLCLQGNRFVPAQWPREKVVRLGFRRWHTTFVWQTPMVCSTCRIMRQPEVTRLGDGRRRFWKQAHALWTGETYPSMGVSMLELMLYRRTLRNLLWGLRILWQIFKQYRGWS
jgi:hypothetical protein